MIISEQMSAMIDMNGLMSLSAIHKEVPAIVRIALRIEIIEKLVLGFAVFVGARLSVIPVFMTKHVEMAIKPILNVEISINKAE